MPTSKKARVDCSTASTSSLLDDLEHATLAVTALEPSAFTLQELQRISDAALHLLQCQMDAENARCQERKRRPDVCEVLLPPDVLELVFSFLKTKDMVRADQTCRYFKQVVMRAACTRVRGLGITLRTAGGRRRTLGEEPGYLRLLARLEKEVRVARTHVANLGSYKSRDKLANCHEAVKCLHGDAVIACIEAQLAKETSGTGRLSTNVTFDLLHFLHGPFDESWHVQHAAVYFQCMRHKDEFVRGAALGIVESLPVAVLTPNVEAFRRIITSKKDESDRLSALMALEKLPADALAPLREALEGITSKEQDVRFAARALCLQLG
jgi:hypothetical protein